ncbi:hypothetical protein [Azospirillum argentinense]|uniref:tetratricopeptide repeat protein n=1 Tax=Azospirillum argentinense TaxID=2970906 RepID=UPI0032DFC442
MTADAGSPPEDRLDAALHATSVTGIVQSGHGNTAIQGSGNSVTAIQSVESMHIGTLNVKADTSTLVPALAEQIFQKLLKVMNGGSAAELGPLAPLLGEPSNALLDSPPASTSGADQGIHAEIDRCRKVLDRGDAATALRLFEELAQAHADASSAVRFRIHTNIGAASLALARADQAAKAFLVAFPLAEPGDETAMRNLVRAHMIREDWPAAQAAARRMISQYPADSNAWGLLVGTSRNETGKLAALVPAALHASIEVTYAVAHAYAQRGALEPALAWMRRAYALEPGALDVLEGLSAFYLQSAAAPGPDDSTLTFMRPLSDTQHIAVLRARTFLRRAWAMVADTPAARHHRSLAVNVAVLHLLVGDTEAAEELLARIDPTDVPEMRRLQAQMALEAGDGKAAFAALRHVCEGAFHDLSLMRASALALENRPIDALGEIDALLADPAAQSLRVRALSLRADLIEDMDGPEPARDDLRARVASGERGIVLLARLAVLAHRTGEGIEADDWFAEAQAALTADSTLLERVTLAHTLHEMGRVEESIAAFNALPLPDADTPSVRQLLNSLIATDRRAAVEARLNRLPTNVRARPFFQRVEAWLRDRSGDLKEAGRLLEAYLGGRPDDLAATLHWIDVQERLGHSEDVKAALGRLLEKSARGTLTQRMALAQILSRYGFVERSWDLAYQTQRRATGDSPDDASAHLSFIGIGLLSAPPHAIDLTRDTVGNDTAFTLVTDDGERTFVIETAPNRSSVVNELAPSHPLAKAVLGCHVGDAIALPGPALPQREGRITAIKHKYLHALHESLSRFPERFPEQRGLQKLRLSMADTAEEQLAPLFAMLDERRAWVAEVEEQYQSLPMPLALLASLLGLHPLDAWAGLANEGRFPILTCHGSTNEFESAVSAIRRCPRVIVDPITLAHIVNLGVADALTALYGPLGVTQSTVDCLRRCVDEQKTYGEKSRRTLSVQDGRYVYREVTTREIELNIAFVERVITYAENHCETVLAHAIADPAPDVRRLFERLDPAFLDTLLAAQSSNRLLLSDDLRLRQWALDMFCVPGAWSQAALWHARSNGTLAPDEYAMATLAIARGRHSFTTFDANVLMTVAARDGWAFNDDLRFLIDLAAGERIDIDSSANVLIGFFDELWKAPLPLATKRRLLFTTLSYLLTPFRAVLKPLIQSLDRSKKAEIRKSLKLWGCGHFFHVPQGSMARPDPTETKPVRRKQKWRQNRRSE